MITLRRVLLDGGEVRDRGQLGVAPAHIAAVYTLMGHTRIILASGDTLDVRESVETVIKLVNAAMPRPSLAA